MTDIHETEYLCFIWGSKSPSGKTDVWRVTSKSSGATLGTIQWFGRWRQYTFDPSPNTTYNKGCLRDIAAFLDAQMEARKR